MLSKTVGGKRQQPHATLIDFGIATPLYKASGSGTPIYMAPELFNGASSHASFERDMWAIGAIMYELLASRRAFGANARACCVLLLLLLLLLLSLLLPPLLLLLPPARSAASPPRPPHRAADFIFRDYGRRGEQRVCVSGRLGPAAGVRGLAGGSGPVRAAAAGGSHPAAVCGRGTQPPVL
jgi:serine/threonine protein kinase